MMKNLTIVLLCLFPRAAVADDIRFAPDVTVTAAVTLVADANGILQIDRSKPILIGSVTPADPTGPTDPIDPVDPIEPADPLAVKVSAIVASAPNTTADVNMRVALASLYETTAKLPLTDPAQIRQATTIIFDALSPSPEWKKWSKDVDSFAASLSLDDVKRAWKLISEGIAK